MLLLGLAFTVCGAAMLVAEAHLPAGVLGLGGGVMLAVGVALAIAGSGGGLALVLAGVASAGLVATAWGGLIAQVALRARGRRAVSGREGLSGRTGVVRSWDGGAGGQVLVDGALWRARPNPFDGEEAAELATGDAVVVEHVHGLTLTVRRAEEWEAVL